MNGTRKPTKVRLEWNAASRALPGSGKSGDLHLVELFTNGGLAAVVDGLGHGEEAFQAALTAINTLERHPDESVISLVNRCHEALRTTRGAVMTLVSFNFVENFVTVLGIGNVETVLLRANSSTKPPAETVLLRGGVVGFQLPALIASIFTISPGDTLVFCTDGIDPAFTNGLAVNEQPKQLAPRILREYFMGNDDAMVLVARFIG